MHTESSDLHLINFMIFFFFKEKFWLFRVVGMSSLAREECKTTLNSPVLCNFSQGGPGPLRCGSRRASGVCCGIWNPEVCRVGPLWYRIVCPVHCLIGLKSGTFGGQVTGLGRFARWALYVVAALGVLGYSYVASKDLFIYFSVNYAALAFLLDRIQAFGYHRHDWVGRSWSCDKLTGIWFITNIKVNVICCWCYDWSVYRHVQEENKLN